VGFDRTSRVLKQLKSKPQVKTPIATNMFIPNHSGDHSKGSVLTTPTNDLDIPNKAYVDDNFLKLDTSNDPLTNPLTIPVGSTALPSLNFTGFETYGLSTSFISSKQNVVISNAGASIMEWSPTTIIARKPLVLAGNELVYGSNLADGGIVFQATGGVEYLQTFPDRVDQVWVNSTYDNQARDFGKSAEATDPKTYWTSGTRWNVATDEWISLQIDSDGDATFATGKGKIILSPTTQTSAGRIVNTTRVTSTPYTILATDHNIFIDTDLAAITANLPAGVDGTYYRIINVGSSGNAVTIAPNGSEKIDGANSSITITDGNIRILVYETTEGWW
jgi:hypothetical protein